MARAPKSSTPDKTKTPATPEQQKRHREVLSALSGLIMGMFVAILAGTVVSTSLPVIVSDLGGNQTAYTWIVTASLLATTVSTPIWGKLADLISRKLLIQLALVIFVIGSALAGFSQDTNTLIIFRILQGLGGGGLTALVQVTIADIISPRERGRYMGLIGGVMALGTVGGPLIGGVITDSLGWRWNFFVALPVAIVALVLIQRTLHLPKRSGKVIVDYFGAILLTGGVSLLLIWVSLGGNEFEWNSAPSYLMVGGAVALLALTVLVELKVKEPIIPLTLFRNRTFVLAVIASLSVGVAMFGTSIFLSQYLQLARGNTPTESGLLTLPMILGLFGASTVIGGIISRTGIWKRYMIVGSVLLTIGLGLMGTLRYDTPYPLMALYMVVMGAGIGMVMQNLVLVTQNSLKASQLGAGSSSIAFFRSLGGTIGVAALGAFLGTRVTGLVTDGLGALGIPAGAAGGGKIPDVSTLPEPIRTVVESAYGEAVGDVFLIVLPLAILTIIMISLLPNKPLGHKTAVQQLRDEELGLLVEVSANDIGSTTTSTGSIPIPTNEVEERAAEEAERSRR
ncbi:MDR family MFS transporter [Amnibacterium flavum]|uniref:MFS transporter n=1 Tax=Amnibacterium flavum TaxID=2173173 RepID=A0A2V1HMF3_9MICO|nr:MDR family MFS transporter [Amnibacterium flavum]PVZ93591.1 MFS transporter [Amnibacterium flavum]